VTLPLRASSWIVTAPALDNYSSACKKTISSLWKTMNWPDCDLHLYAGNLNSLSPLRWNGYPVFYRGKDPACAGIVVRRFFTRRSRLMPRSDGTVSGDILKPLLALGFTDKAKYLGDLVYQ